MTKNEILAAFHFRHACKEFDLSKKITEEDFLFILETARLSPSSFGFEPWHFLIVQDQTLRDKLKPGAWGATLKLETASHLVVCLCMKAPLIRYNSEYLQDFMKTVQMLCEERITQRTLVFENFQKHDFDLINGRHLFDWAAKQSYIAMGNMMTAAAMIGIDSCPIEGYCQETTDSILAKEFGVDLEQYGISYMLAFGYRVKEQSAKKRRALDKIVTWT